MLTIFMNFPTQMSHTGYCKSVSSSSVFTSDCINSALWCPQPHSLVGAPGAAEVGCESECLWLFYFSFAPSHMILFHSTALILFFACISN